MEQHPHQGGDLQDTRTPHIPPPEQPPSLLPENQEPPESHDERIIRAGIEQAHQAGTDIDNRTARYIAAQLHDGQASALYSLASTGTIAESLQDELTRNLDQQTSQVQTWITWLGSYCRNREHKGPVPNWAASAAAIDRAEQAETEAQACADEEAGARQELMARISAASVTTLGRIATIVTAGDSTASNTVQDTTDHHTNNHHHQADHDETTQDTELDVFPWHDAAHWSPDDQSTESTQDQLDLLFSQAPAATIGSVERMGWFGLLTQDGQSGGIILSRNSYGSRHAWATTSDEELTQQWEQLQREHDAFTEATRGRRSVANRQHNTGGDGDEQQDRHAVRRAESTEQAENAQEQTTRGCYPEIWVGSLSDYTNGHLHGAWLDATLDPEDLHNAIQYILRHSYYPGAEEWAIMDYDDFCGLNLGEYEPLEVISRIANGIAEHGEAFAKWAEYVGERSEELLTDERFQDHYLGHFESTEAYVENLLEETNAYEFEEFVPEWLKPYVKIDVELLARDSEIELYVVEAEDGGVFVFDTRG